ncbi:DUF1214 domain-containing protein [Rhodococcus sp. OK302]|uniref:DUF1214 domain-containing protein n=1 Tax=Rhodococcus sp. OK302 TaxID=1882769 RepID=UPI000B9F0A03|nr:DUF1214 domain-containing protein [Rhodococcus sp. OK302]OYD70425.1 uncharacterized protein DUF1214 [Rhodococcus sp. OK302]
MKRMETSIDVDYVGALATPVQREGEELTRRILETDAYRNAIRHVEMLYAADPQGSTPAGKATISRAAHSLATAVTQYAICADPGDPRLMWGVTAPHEFQGLSSPRSGFGIENPDNVYRHAAISGASTYEIRGKVNYPGPTEQHFEMRDAVPGTTALTTEGGTQLAGLHSDDIVATADGSFVITLDAQPANGRSNHIQIPAEQDSFLIVRDLFNDWSTENVVRLDLVRTAGPAAREPQSLEQLTTRSVELLTQLAPFWLDYFNQYFYTEAANHVRSARRRPAGRGLSTGGWFDVNDGEALVVTVDPLGAKSLGIQISDPWGVAYEYIHRTSSLNTVQAEANSDGTYSFVICREDPGAYNWLDPEGHNSGMVAVRWQSLPAEAAINLAVRSVEIVKLEQLVKRMPAGTSFLTMQQREQQQSSRANDYVRRYTG